MKLVKQQIDTNDGDYVYGFEVMTNNEYDNFVKGYKECWKLWKNEGDTPKWWINNSEVYIETLEKYVETLEVTSIDTVEAGIIEKTFGSTSWGDFHYLEY